MFEIEDIVFITFGISALTGIGIFFIYLLKKCFGGTQLPQENNTVKFESPSMENIHETLLRASGNNPYLNYIPFNYYQPYANTKQDKTKKIVQKAVKTAVKSFREAVLDAMLESNTSLTPVKCMSILRRSSLTERRLQRSNQ